jgi:hypothetical protein
MGNKNSKINENSKIIEFLEFEAKLHFTGDHASTAIGSVYSVEDFAQPENIKASLNSRFKQILTSNPWLMGRVRTLSNPSRVALVIEEKFSNPEDYIFTGENSSLIVPEAGEDVQFSGVTYNCYRKILTEKKYNVGNSLELADKDDGILTKFGMVWNPDMRTYAVVLTINHIIADGNTVYNIWKMIDENAEIVSLTPERSHTFEKEKLVETQTSLTPPGMGQYEAMAAWMTHAFGTCVKKGLQQRFQRYPQDEWLLVLDETEIKTIKEKYNTGDSFVSTNDVILSWLRELTPKTDNIMIPINLRNKIEGLNSNLAGNYLGVPMIRNKDLETPKTVRTWLNNVCAPGYEWRYPSKKDFQKYLGGIVTNWAGFYHHVEPKGSKQVFHFPVVPPVVYSYGGLPIGAELDVVIFKPNQSETAVMLFSRRRNLNDDFVFGQRLVKGELMKMK